MKTNNKFLKEAEKLQDWMINVRRDFHQHPELGMEEFRTRDKIVEYLNEMGIEYYTGIANTGLVGIIRGNKEGRTIALRADMDALPIEDKKQVEYKSRIPGKMHACGHDAHMTILLGAARILNNMKDRLEGNVKLLFQPAEETVGGAKPMIEAGVMENPKVNAVFGLHVSSEIQCGKIGIKYGQMNAASDSIKIIIHGKSGHGAYPHTAIDAIVIAGQIITGIQTIVSRNVDPRDCALVTIGTIKGGTQENIIADKVELGGTVRTLNPITREGVLENIKSITCQIAESMGGRVEFIREKGYIPLINNNECVDLVKKNAEKILACDKIEIIEDASLGVEDFAYFVDHTPGAFFRLGCGNIKAGIIESAHNPLFDIDEKCLAIGVALQVKNVITALENK